MREREEREGERKNYVRKNVIECTHTSKHFCMKSLVKFRITSVNKPQLILLCRLAINSAVQ